MTKKARARITRSAVDLVDRAGELADCAGQPRHGANYLLQAMSELRETMFAALTGGRVAKLPAAVRRELDAGLPGAFVSPAELERETARAAAERGSDYVWEKDVALAILRLTGFYQQTKGRDEPHHPARPREPSDAGAPAQAAPRERPDSGRSARESRATPALRRFGRDLTRAAADGELAPMVGRDHEVAIVLEVLCRDHKRNPVLLGPAGVGKTAIVEGLAQRIASGDGIPDLLRGARVVEIVMPSVIAGIGFGDLEQRMTDILAEASHRDTVLFIDELHMVLGGGVHLRDVSQMLKPALARGGVAVVGATTDEEYRRIVDQDSALERRFQPVQVPEMDRGTTLRVLQAHRDSLEASRGVRLDDAVLTWLVAFADDFMRNRYFPDKALDLLEQCIARAVVEGKRTLERETVEAVAQQLVGMPLDIRQRLARLKEQLFATGLLADHDARTLLERLRVTMGGHDFDPVRPNAMVLLAGRAAARADLLAAVCSEALYGSSQRVVNIDLAGLQADSNVSMTRLLGLPYGYVGADLGKGDVQVLNGRPWSTIIIRNLDQCDGLFVKIVADALLCGYFMDAHGVRQYLSDAVVLLTAGETATHGVPLGFVPAEDDHGRPAAAAQLERLLGRAVTAQCQIVTDTGPPERAARGWLAEIALPALSARYAAAGLVVEWDDSVIAWLVAEARDGDGPDEWRALLESRLGPRLADILYEEDGAPGQVRVVCDQDGLAVVRQPS